MSPNGSMSPREVPGDRHPSDGVIKAAAPARIRKHPTEALLAQFAVSKYADGLPIYRHEAIYARDQVEIDRSQMAQWMGKVGFELEPLADYALTGINQGERVFADETTLPTLAAGSGKAKTAYLWTYLRDDRPFGGSGPPIRLRRRSTPPRAAGPVPACWR